MNDKSVQIVITAQDTKQRLAVAPSVEFTDKTPEGASLLVEDRVRYQTIEGFGGAFTESAAETLLKLSPEKQEEVLNAYFDERTGLGYKLCRTHINSCDFSLENWSHDEVAGDTELKHFSIARDRRAMLPMIKRANAIAGGDIKLFASPWSPPAWMKTNGKMNNGGKLIAKYRAAWALWFAKYIKAVRAEGIKIWGVTVQNEPEAVQTWDSCIYTAEEERDFVREHLGPTLAREGLGGVKIIIWDHNRDELFRRAKGVLDDPEAAKYVWGVGFHWYGADKFENVEMVHDAYPDKPLLLTEACVEMGPHLGDWSIGETYARSVIQDLNHWAAGWVDWNLLLDERGGPNHVGNYCSAPILVDTKKGEVFYNNSFYYLGHFARFIRPGAKRVICAPNRDALEATAAVNPDGSFAVVAMNRTDKALPFSLCCAGKSALVELPPHAIITATWKA